MSKMDVLYERSHIEHSSGHGMWANLYSSILSFTTAITKNKKEKRESSTAQKPHLSDDWNSNKITMAQDRRKVQNREGLSKGQ